MKNSNRLFYGSCFALITTALSFSIRAGILPQLADTFSLSAQQLGFINYFTKAGDRKRYFKVAEKDTFFLKKLNLSLTKIEKESEIIDKVSAYNKKFNPEKFHTNEDKREVYTKCLNDMTKTLQSTITKLKELQV